jgi:hypothetical protein
MLSQEVINQIKFKGIPMFLCYNTTETIKETIEEGVDFSIHQFTQSKGIVHTRLSFNRVTRETGRDSKYVWSKFTPLNARVKTITTTPRKSAKLVDKLETRLKLAMQECPSNLNEKEFDEFCQNLFDSFAVL